MYKCVMVRPALLQWLRARRPSRCLSPSTWFYMVSVHARALPPPPLHKRAGLSTHTAVCRWCAHITIEKPNRWSARLPRSRACARVKQVYLFFDIIACVCAAMHILCILSSISCVWCAQSSPSQSARPNDDSTDGKRIHPLARLFCRPYSIRKNRKKNCTHYSVPIFCERKICN